jgi:hypothetical protein
LAARTAYERGDALFIYNADLMTQQAVILHMAASTKTNKTTSDPSEILNAIVAEGWDLFSASTAFVPEGEQSRDKMFTPGQSVAVKGKLAAHYLFKRSTPQPAATA